MKERSKISKTDTKELITLFQTETNSIGDNAFYSLVHLFRRDLLNFCEIRCKAFGHGPNVAEVIVTKTFEAYAKKGNFRFENAKGKNDYDSFLIYLFAIAKNTLTDYYRDQKREKLGLKYDGTEAIVTELPELPGNVDIEPQIKYKVLQSLPYAHRVIYLTYKSHERAGCNLPKHLHEKLRSHLNDISQVTIRTYKKVATDKINDALLIMNLTKTNNK